MRTPVIIVVVSLLLPLLLSIAASADVVPDTGITKCYDGSSEIPCPSPGEDFYGQDANYTAPERQHSYTDNGDGTVTDNVTGLMWMQDDDDISRTWQDAINYCDSLTHAGYSDWRLPDYYELSYLTDKSRPFPAIDPVFSSRSSSYWTSSPYAGNSGGAWGVGFGYGDAYGGNKDGTYYVRCVRSGP